MTRQQVIDYIEKQTGIKRPIKWLTDIANRGAVKPKKVPRSTRKSANDGLYDWRYEWTLSDANDACDVARSTWHLTKKLEYEYMPTPERIKAECERFRKENPRNPDGYVESDWQPTRIQWIGYL